MYVRMGACVYARLMRILVANGDYWTLLMWTLIVDLDPDWGGGQRRLGGGGGCIGRWTLYHEYRY